MDDPVCKLLLLLSAAADRGNTCRLLLWIHHIFALTVCEANREVAFHLSGILKVFVAADFKAAELFISLSLLSNIYFISKYFEFAFSNGPDSNKGVYLSEECRLHALCVPIDLTGGFFTVKSSFEHIRSCFCGARRAAPISWRPQPMPIGWQLECKVQRHSASLIWLAVALHHACTAQHITYA